MPPCGGAPYSKSVEQEAKTPASFFFSEPEGGKYLGLHVAAMDTNGAGTQFDAVQDQIVGFCAAMRRIVRKFLQIFIVNGGEGVMRGIPALVFFVPLEHWEIDDPEKAEDLRIEKMVAVVVFLAQVQTELSGGEQRGPVGQGAFGLAGPGR